MIDLHTHILHGIDDGPRDLAGALELARAALDDGVRTLAATPHGRSSVGGGRYSVAALRERLAELRAALAAQGLPLEIVEGTEIYGEGGLVQRLRRGELLGYAGSRALLVEFPANTIPAAVEQIVFELQLAGHRVVVAHPERLRYAQDDPNVLIPLIERGALMQLTADALLGNHGERRRRLAETMLGHGLVQLIASDAHGAHVGRLPNLGAATRRAAELVGAPAAVALSGAVPAAILADSPIDPPAPTRVRRRFGFL
jgi:protein-tyrosine phosphatase